MTDPVCTRISDTITTCVTTTRPERDWIDVVYASTQIAMTLFLIAVVTVLVVAFLKRGKS